MNKREVFRLYKQPNKIMIRRLASKVKRYFDEWQNITIEEEFDKEGQSFVIYLVGGTKRQQEISMAVCFGYYFGWKKLFKDELFNG
jgi:hypothetical protein